VVRDSVAPGQIEVEVRAINPEVVRNSPVRIGQFTMNRVLQRPQNRCPRLHGPSTPGDCIPRCPIDYKVQSSDVKRMRQDNPFAWSKFEGVDDRFWSQFHNDYYSSVCMKTGIRGLTTPIIMHKASTLLSLQSHNHPEIDALIQRLEDWCILPLMTFKHDWNSEILCQFWATLYIDEEHKVLHWMTEGLHYRCDYRQFSRLLGFNRDDRAAPSLYDRYPDGAGKDDFVEAALYIDPTKANGKIDGLKPYFYVLNNLLRATIDPKIGDATTVQNHAPTILVCFGLGKRFSVTDLMWRHIQEVSLTSSQSFPYAPYLMYIIEQFTGFGFHHDVSHPDWNVKRLQAKASQGKEPATDVGGSDHEPPADDAPHVPSMDPPPSASGGRGRGRGNATRHAL